MNAKVWIVKQDSGVYLDFGYHEDGIPDYLHNVQVRDVCWPNLRRNRLWT